MNRIEHPGPPSPPTTPHPASQPGDILPSRLVEAIAPHHRSIIGVDIEDATARTNVVRGALRLLVYSLVEEAMQIGGISDRYRNEWADLGDGVLFFVHPVDQVPKTLLVNRIIPTLSTLLASHNAKHPNLAFRMRAVVHAGEVHFDERGCFGEAVDLSCRLLDSAQLKRSLKQTAANLVLVVSDYFYQSVIRHGYDGIDEQDFERIVQVRLGKIRHRGWVNIPKAAMIPAPIIRPVTDLDSRRGPGGSER